MTLNIGDKAPAISLFDTEKNKVNLSDFNGKNVVVLFFPQAFTGVCTAELCATRDDIATYNNANAQVLAISVDSVFTLGKFKADQQLNFPLLSDFNKRYLLPMAPCTATGYWICAGFPSAPPL